MAKKTQIKKKEYTLSEFKAWLEGVEELQPTNWAPDASQWKLIRDRIYNIVEEVVEVEVPSSAGPMPRGGPPGNNPFEQVAPQGPQGDPWAAPLVQPAPVAPGGSALDGAIEPPAIPSIPGTGRGAPPMSRTAPPGMQSSPDGKIKTPDIDTRDGNYESTFG